MFVFWTNLRSFLRNVASRNLNEKEKTFRPRLLFKFWIWFSNEYVIFPKSDKFQVLFSFKVILLLSCFKTFKSLLKYYETFLIRRLEFFFAFSFKFKFFADLRGDVVLRLIGRHGIRQDLFRQFTHNGTYTVEVIFQKDENSKKWSNSEYFLYISEI